MDLKQLLRVLNQAFDLRFQVALDLRPRFAVPIALLLLPAPSEAQSHLRHPLTALRGSAGHVRVLRALASNRVLQSAPQLAAAAGLTSQGTRGVLHVLARQRLVKVHGSGRTQLHELAAAHPLASSLAALFRTSKLGGMRS